MNINTNSIPESGQIVEVRHRQWVVLETSSSLIKPLQPLQPTQHVVSLSSIEDDAFGEELQVLWELEVGTQIREKAELPTPSGFDTPELLDTFLNALDSNCPFYSGNIKNNQTYAPSIRADQPIHHYKALPNHTYMAQISHYL